MSRKLQHPYFCHHCKKLSKHVDEFFLVEENQSLTFCSEKCIVEFFSPLIASYEEDEAQRREKIGIKNEAAAVLRDSQKHVQSTLEAPDKIYESNDELTRKHYTFIKEFKEAGEQFWYIIVCMLYEKQPSFVFLQTATQSDELLNYYSVGELIDGADIVSGSDIQDSSTNSEGSEESEDGFTKITLPPEIIEDLELKKSTSLATLMMDRSESDIPFEQYPLYDEYLSETLEDPDEIYLTEDDSGDPLYCYLKANEKEGTPFFYIVLCVKIDSELSKQEHALFPILSFPSVDPDLCSKFKQGERLTGTVLN